jgi:hypothetical protein
MLSEAKHLCLLSGDRFQTCSEILRFAQNDNESNYDP